jgi:uncharacterized protein
MKYLTEIEQIVKALDLEPHPEGGFFKETYRSTGMINQENLGNQYQGDRNYSTGIYFLLTSENFSAFHRIKQDEMWHFYDGSPICIHSISPEGVYNKTLLGRNIASGEKPQFVVKGGDWFAASVPDENTYSLVGCTVAPGFNFMDFELPKRNELLKSFTEHQKIITALTRA